MATSNSYTKAESDARYALKTQLADYAKRSELPSAAVFVTRKEFDDALAAENVLIQGLQIGKASTGEVQQLGQRVATCEAKVAAVQEALDAGGGTTPDLSTFETKAHAEATYATKEAMQAKADESTVQTLRSAVSQNTTAIAGLAESKADASALESYAKKSDIPAAPDLSDYAKKSDIPAVPDLSDYAKKSDIPAAPDLSDYAKKSEVPSAETVSSLSETVANQGRGLAALQTSKADASAIADMATKAWVRQFINDLDASDKEY